MGNRFNLPVPFGWYGVELAKDLAPGEIKTLNYFGEEFVLFRTADGAAQAVEAYCPHLGAHLGVESTVVGDTIRCPFHHWRFGTDGFVKEIPYASQIPAKLQKDPCLYTYPTVEMNQTIWVWYHPDRVEPSFDVIELEQMTGNNTPELEVYDWVVHAHIQETSENAADAAHFAYVHNSAYVPEGTVTHEGTLRIGNFDSQTPALDEEGNFDTTGTQFMDSHLFTCNNGPGQTWQRFTGIFDTFMMGLITPIDNASIRMRFVFPKIDYAKDIEQIMARGFIDNVCSQVEQDITIWNHKIYRPKPALCDGDGPINQFRQWFSQFYADAPANQGISSANSQP